MLLNAHTTLPRALDPLKESANLAQIYQDVTIGLAVFDMNLKYVHVNKRMAEINGTSVALHAGMSLQEINPRIALAL